MELVDQLLDAILGGYRLVVDDVELGDALEPQARADLAPQEWQRTVERAIGMAPTLFISQRGIEDARLLEVTAHLDPRDRDEPEARIVHLAREQLTELAADLVGDAIRSLSFQVSTHKQS
jgi:hypothetical protein